MGFLPLLPSCGKSGKRINYRIFATFAIGPGRLCQSFCLLFYSFIPVDDAHYSV